MVPTIAHRGRDGSVVGGLARSDRVRSGHRRKGAQLDDEQDAKRDTDHTVPHFFLKFRTRHSARRNGRQA